MCLSRCPKFINLPKNFGNLEHLNWLYLKGTAIKVLPSSVGSLAALQILNLSDCKNLVRLPNTICDLKKVKCLLLIGCSKIANLPKNLGNMESLRELSLDGTAIKELPSSTIHLKQVGRVSFKGCQLSSSLLASMPRCYRIDLSDCNLSAIPSGIDRISIMDNLFDLSLRGNDFISIPEIIISQFSALTHLYLDGCKSLRSLSNIPSKVEFICLDNCTSLERLSEPPNVDFYWSPSSYNYTVQCFNCFKLASNFQNFSNMFQFSRDRGESVKQPEKCYIIPGREIPEWFEEVNMCDTSVGPPCLKKARIQLRGSGSECWRIVLCVVFLPFERFHGRNRGLSFSVYGCKCTTHSIPVTWTMPTLESQYGKVELHHLCLHSVSMRCFCLPETPGFHQVELNVWAVGVEVEKIGFCVV